MPSPQATQIDPLLLQRAVARAELDIRAAKADPWHLVKKGWVITLDEKPPEGVPAIRPLPADPYLEALTRLWEGSSKGLLAKSRQMRVSWLFAWLTLWDALFHDGRHCLIQGKRLEDVDASSPHHILGRVRFMREHLPPFLRAVVKAENTTSETYANGSTIEAIPEGEDIVRGKVPSNMLMEEIAFQETAERNWNAAVPSAGKLWGVTTPNGHEFLYRQAEEGRPWDDLTGGKAGRWPEVMTGLYGYKNSRDIQLVGLHYTADERERTVEAQAKRASGYTSARAHKRENELDFTLAAGLGVFANDFDVSTHVIERYKPDPHSPVYRGWDFGYNGQAVAWFQTNHDGQLVWFDQVILKAVPLPRVIQEAKRRTLAYLAKDIQTLGTDGMFSARRESSVADYGDPSGEAHNTKGETDAATLSQHGIQLITKSTTGRKRALVENIRKLLLPRSDGRPALVVARNSPEMDHVIAGFSGGYHYAEPKDGKAEKEVPHKDGLYDHVFDAAQYAIDHISPVRFGLPEMEKDPEWWKDPDLVGVGNEGYGV